MLQTKYKSTQLNVFDLLEKAKKFNHKYISIVERIERIDPIDFYASFDHTFGNRYFWKQALEALTFVGIGVEKTFTIQHFSNRYKELHSQWQTFLKDIYFQKEAQWTGPVLLGGFSFFDENEAETKWDKFPNAQMVLPKVMLTVNEDECFITFNFAIDENTTADELEEKIETTYKQVLNKKDDSKTNVLQKTSTVHFDEWETFINEAVSVIKNGDLGKVVLARELEAIFNEKITIHSVLKQLYETEEDCYIFAFENENDHFVGATPERLVRVEGDELLSTCLAGTISRGKDEREDEKFATMLLNDHKNREEHQFVVDMVKRAIEPYSEDAQIPENPTIYRLKHLQHLYTPVTAKLKKGHSIFDLVKSLHPTPALGGNPTHLALDYINEYEPFDRGWYAAPIGFVDDELNGEFAVAIRSALIQGNKATLFAGCGIVGESDPKEEYKETDLKFTPMLKALGGTNE